jgi:hypothetical protein
MSSEDFTILVSQLFPSYAPLVVYRNFNITT